MESNIEETICSICANSFSREGKQEKSKEKCSREDCEALCVMNSDLCQIHNRVRYPIMCLACNKSCCRMCYTTYFLTEEDDITRCVHCKKLFDIEFLLGEDSNYKQRFPKSFIWGELKEHREKVLLDKIMAKMPSYQRAASAIHKIEDLLLQSKEIDSKIATLKFQQIQIHREIVNQKNIVNNTETKGSKPVSYVTRGKCPSETCNGFIEDKWECGMCHIKICSHCMMIKTEEPKHVCNEDDVKSTELIRESTKPCPSCRTRIYRIEGCFAENTEILMYDTTLKMSQNIAIGDVLIGDDGEKRTVLELVSGTDKMYEITQNNGETYIVNSKHTLVLSDVSDRIHEITVDDYLKLGDTKKSLLYGIKSSNGINYHEQHVEMDPYLLGLWLGDGTHTHPVIASNDNEIQTYILNWCKNNDCEMTHEEGVKFLIRRKGNSNGKDTLKNPIGYSSCEDCKGCKKKEQKICDYKNEEILVKREKRSQSNPFLEQLRKYDLIGNKHIPKEYLMNSRKVRLALLAGLIDTDGCSSNNGKRIVIIQTKKDLSEQIISLARSLGFVVNFTIRERKNESIFGLENKDYQNQYAINISGENLSEIPTLLPRKKCENSNSNKNLFKSSIKIKFIGENKYYGWKIDGNNRFLAKDHTILRNCSQMFCTNCHILFCWNSGLELKKTQYVHNPHYTEFLQKNALVENNGCDRMLNQYSFNELQISREQARKYLNLYRKANHILDSVRNYVDPIEEKIRDVSIKYINRTITKSDLATFVQKYHKASKKNELANMRRTTFGNMILEILTKLVIDAKGKTSQRCEQIVVEIDRMLAELEELTEDSMINIGKMFNSGTPEIVTTTFFEY